MNSNQSNDPQSGQQNQKAAGIDLSGIDLSGILPPGTWEVVKPFFSNGLVAGGIYLFLIKPLKEKIEYQTTQIVQMEARLKDQEEDLEDMEERVEALEKSLKTVIEGIESKAGLFDTRRRDTGHSSGSSDTWRSGSGSNGVTF